VRPSVTLRSTGDSGAGAALERKPPRWTARADRQYHGGRTGDFAPDRAHDRLDRQLSEPPSHSLVIADDHPLFRGALRQAVSGLFGNAEISEAGSFEETTELLERRSDVDLILLDLSMPGVRGFSGLMYLRAQFPSLPVVVVSANDEPAVIRRCMEFGASGFIPKTLGGEALRQAIGRVLQGEIWTPPDIDLAQQSDSETASMIARLSTLTPQQVRVLMMLSDGLLNKQIAYELGISEATVKAHVSAILQKLGVESRTQAVIAAGRIEAGQ
jgi:DNA-binding NarL/FixJ family response regulator